MKSLLLIGCLLLAADMIRAGSEVSEALREDIDACAAEQNIVPEELLKMDATELEGEDRKKIGCLKLCVMKRAQLFDGENLNAEKYEEVAGKIFKGDADKVAKSMEDMAACVVEAKDISDECEAAYVFSRCVMLKNSA